MPAAKTGSKAVKILLYGPESGIVYHVQGFALCCPKKTIATG